MLCDGAASSAPPGASDDSDSGPGTLYPAKEAACTAFFAALDARGVSAPDAQRRARDHGDMAIHYRD